MTLYVDKPAEKNGDLKRLQTRLLRFLDQETANGFGSDYVGVQAATFTVTGFNPEDGEEETFVVRFDNQIYTDA